MAKYEEEEEGSIVPSAPMERLSTGEIMSQVEIAKRNPRDLVKFQKNLVALVASSPDVAQSAFYTLKRKSKNRETGKTEVKIIQGPSIHLMRLAAPLFKNLRWGGRQMGEDGGFVVAQGVSHDLEANLFVSVEVRRPIVTRDGRRYTADMVNTTTMAAIAIAMRNALGNTISKPLWEPAYLKAKEIAVGTVKSLPERRKKCVAEFAKLGVTEQEILDYCDVDAVEKISLDHLELLLGTYTGITEEGMSIDEAFGREKAPIQEPGSKPAAGPAPSPGGPLEAALAGEPEPGPQPGLTPEVPPPAPPAPPPPTPAPPPGGGTAKIPTDRIVLLAGINRALAQKPQAEQDRLWSQYLGKINALDAPVGKLGQLWIALKIKE